MPNTHLRFYGVSEWLPQAIRGNTASVFFRPEDRAIAAAESASRMELLDPFTIDFAPVNSSNLDMTVLCQDKFPRARFDCPSAEMLARCCRCVAGRQHRSLEDTAVLRSVVQHCADYSGVSLRTLLGCFVHRFDARATLAARRMLPR